MTAAAGIRGLVTELTWLLRRRRFDYRDAVVLITGGAGGIGSALADHVAQRGGRVVVVDLDGERATAVVQGLPGAAEPGRHLAVRADLTDLAQVERVVAEVEAGFGRIDVLVNNAGMTSSERFADRTPASIEHEIRVNTIAPLLMARLALPLLRRSSDPRLLSTISLAGIWPQAETPVYSASKFGLRGAMLSIAMDLHRQGVQVGSVLPSATDTPMLQQEAIEGGNVLQFQGPPQSVDAVVAAFASLLDRPRLEVFPKPREAALVRVVMLLPNTIHLLLPLVQGRGERGMGEYLEQLAARGDIERVDGRWQPVRRTPQR